MFKLSAASAKGDSPVAQALEKCRTVLPTLALTSGVINVLTLTGSIFMMQVYDRVLSSQSVATLIGLSMLALGAYVFQGWLEILRSRILTLVGEKVDVEISGRLHTAGLKTALASPNGQAEAVQSTRDIEAIRNFVGGPGLVVALDLPWLPMYLLVTTLLHPLLGLATLVGALLLILITWKTEKASQAPTKKTFEANNRRNQQFESSVRGAEAVAANGMRAHLGARVTQSHEEFLAAQRQAAFVITRYGIAAKTTRMLLQSFMLGFGAYLAIKGQISPGAIIAASILSARALSPIDQAIASWRPFMAARDGYKRLTALLARVPVEPERFELTPPKHTLSVEQVAVVPPGLQRPSVHGVSLSLKAGDAVGVIGGSASGKSSFVRSLVNAWRPAQGVIRLDGSTLDQWTQEEIGKSIGYLPQDFQLFEGTVAQNIGRFDPNASDNSVRAAATAAGMDDYIRRVLGGYDKPIGPGGAFMSAGQRQRIGLARALYGDPFLVVLDEPNSNLDPGGEVALQAAVKGVRARGGIVVVVTHRDKILDEVDHLLALNNGTMVAFGPKPDVMKKLAASYVQAKDAKANGAPVNGVADGAHPTPAPPSGPAAPITAPTDLHAEAAPARTQWSSNPMRLARSIGRRSQ